MLVVINVDVFWNLWGRRARSLMFAKPYLQGSFSLTNIHRIALFSFDLVHWSHYILFTHGILWFHQQLSQCACWFKICWNAIISENSPHCSENSFTYGITTEIFFDRSFTDVSIVSPGSQDEIRRKRPRKQIWVHFLVKVATLAYFHISSRLNPRMWVENFLGMDWSEIFHD